mgnify:CR=1 FL=1
MVEKDYYKILGIEKGASQDEIKKAFRHLARKHHPDVNQGNKESEDKFKEVNEAFQVLGNEKKKAQYDQYGSSAFSQEDMSGFREANFNFDDLFSDLGIGDIFNMFSGGRGRRRQREDYEEGADLRFDLEISLEEAFNGVKKEIVVPINEICKNCDGNGAESNDIETCDKCKGSGEIKNIRRQGYTQFVSVNSCDKCRGIGKIISKYCTECKGRGKNEKEKKIDIKIPKGIGHGQHLRIEGAGELGRNAPDGDLYIVIHVKNHPNFKREDENLFLEKSIGLSTAIFGGNVEIQGIDKKLNLKIPASTQSHTPFKLEGQGMPFVNSKGRGDLYVLVNVEIPKMNKNKEKLFKDLFDKS